MSQTNLVNSNENIEEEFYLNNWDYIADIFYDLKNDYEIFGLFNKATLVEYYDIVYNAIILTKKTTDNTNQIDYDSDYSDDS
jgi:hypothetical protein